MFAIIETGGKQYKVETGKKIRVEKLNVNPLAGGGEKVLFDRVLLRVEKEGVEIGAPYLKGAKVEGKVSKSGRHERKIVFRYHSKTRYRKFKTHRQPYTEVEITKV